MSRYIDADAFNKDLQKRWNINSDHDFADKEVWRALEDAPSIDIVRCGECKKAHLTADGTCKYCEEWKDNDGDYIEVYHNADDFCSYGERKDDE